MKHFWILVFPALLSFNLCAQESVSTPDTEMSEEQLRIQIYLDQQKFRPGKLDGHQGEFTDKALARGAQARGSSPDDLKKEAQAAAAGLWTEYTVQASDLNYVGELPEKPAEMAKLKFLPYRSLGELVAERYHTDLAYLRKLNDGQDIDKLQAGAVLKVPAVEPFVIETVFPEAKAPETEAVKPEADSDAETAAKAGRNLVIHRSEHILEVWENDKLIASFPVSVGPPDNETPAGDLSIKSITFRPTFRHDEKMLKEGVRGEKADLFPPGPNNPVGVIWIQTSKDGIGIHGTNDPDLIGRNVSSGCIRLSNWDVVALAGLVKAGCKIKID